MTAIKTSSITIVGEGGERNAELETVLGPGFDVSPMPVCRDTFDILAYDSTDILLVFDDPGIPDLIGWIAALYNQRALPTVFFSTTDSKQRIHAAIATGVTSYIYDGFRPARVHAILETVIARFEQRSLLEEELASARQDLDDRKVIDRAKGLIMAQPGCREEEAYSSLRRQAMESSRKIGGLRKRRFDGQRSAQRQVEPSRTGRKSGISQALGSTASRVPRPTRSGTRPAAVWIGQRRPPGSSLSSRVGDFLTSRRQIERKEADQVYPVRRFAQANSRR
jgi:hypothetical protein